MTHDTGHMTCDTLWGVNIISKLSFEGLEEKDVSLTEVINDKGVCRTAPATTGLLIIYLLNQ